MNRELVLQELSDEQLELVTGGDGGITIIINVYYITQNIDINNSVLINSSVGNSALINSSVGNSALRGSPVDSFNVSRSYASSGFWEDNHHHRR